MWKFKFLPPAALTRRLRSPLDLGYKRNSCEHQALCRSQPAADIRHLEVPLQDLGGCSRTWEDAAAPTVAQARAVRALRFERGVNTLPAACNITAGLFKDCRMGLVWHMWVCKTRDLQALKHKLLPTFTVSKFKINMA